jgi:hypothetical protein
MVATPISPPVLATPSITLSGLLRELSSNARQQPCGITTGRCAHGDDIEGRLIACVSADIDQDAQVLHLADDLLALRRQARLRIERAAAKLIGCTPADYAGCLTMRI